MRKKNLYEYNDEYRKERIIFIVSAIVLFLLVGVIIGMCITYYTLCNSSSKSNKIESMEINNTTNITLQSILNKEINILENNNSIDTTDWVCLDYATYFNNTLTTKYPFLDTRWIRYFDICNNLTMCSTYHTYLVIGGFGSECLLNSDRYDCVDFNINISGVKKDE